MAVTSGTVWELRPDGSSSNGGGFDSSLGGTDYSQQAAAQLTVTDAACGNTTTITSATGGFTPAMVGNCVNVNGQGIGATVFQIVSVTNGNTIVVDRTAGTFGGKTLKVGGAMSIGASGFDPFGFVAPKAGNKLWVRGTNSGGVTTAYTATAAIHSGTIAPTALDPITTEGYGTTRGDGVPATINVTGGDVEPAGYEVWKNLKFVDQRPSGSTALLDVAGANSVLQSVTLVGAGNDNPVFVANGSEACLFRGCLFDGNGSAAAFPFGEAGSGNVYRDCVFKGAAGSGAYALTLQNFDTTVFDACLFIDNTATLGAIGVDTGGHALNRFRNCVIWNNAGNGVTWVNGNLLFAAFDNCIFGKNAGYDLASLVAGTAPGGANFSDAQLDCNFFLTTGTARYHNVTASASDTTLAVSPFTNDSGGDFSLNSTAGGGAAISSGLCKTTLPGSVNVTDTQTAGPYGQVATAAPTATVTMRSLWRELTNERDTVVIPDSVVDEYLDYGLQELNRRVHYHYTTASDITLVAGVQEYAMPVDAIEIVWIQYGSNRLLEKGDVEQWRRRGDDWRNEPEGQPLAWAHYGNQFVIRPRPSAQAVAAAPNLTLRRKDTPPSITTAGPEQLPTEAYRIVVIYGAYLWSVCYPDSVVAQQRAVALKAEFEAGVAAMTESYARRSVSL